MQVQEEFDNDIKKFMDDGYTELITDWYLYSLKTLFTYLIDEYQAAKIRIFDYLIDWRIVEVSVSNDKIVHNPNVS